MDEMLAWRQTSSVVWWQAFPGRLEQVREARRRLALLLAGRRHVDDALLCLAELGANAVLHSNTRDLGGSFTVHARASSEHIYIEVRDQGGPWSAVPAQENACNGRGLLIVSQLAADWGISGDETGRTLWCELHDHPPGPEPLAHAELPTAAGRNRS